MHTIFNNTSNIFLNKLKNWFRINLFYSFITPKPICVRTNSNFKKKIPARRAPQRNLSKIHTYKFSYLKIARNTFRYKSTASHIGTKHFSRLIIWSATAFYDTQNSLAEDIVLACNIMSFTHLHSCCWNLMLCRRGILVHCKMYVKHER